MTDSTRSLHSRIAVVHLGRNGGGPKFTFELARACATGGAEVLSVVSSGADNVDHYEQVGRTLVLPTFATSLGAVVKSPLSIVHGFRFAVALVRFDIDAVVVGMEQIWQLPLLVAARAVGRPVLLGVHDATMHPGEANRVERAIRAAHRRLASGLIAFSGHVAAVLGATQRKPVFRTIHPAYGTDDVSAVRLLPADGHVPVVGFFGRLSAYKGLGLGYRAIEMLRSSGQRVVFRVVGEGDTSDLPEVGHADDDVRNVWTADPAIPGVLADFDVLLLPYLEASQSGVLAYALSAALPSVVTPVGGLVEQAEETGAAVVASGVSPEAVANALLDVLRSPSKYAELSARAVDAARGTHSWARVADDVFGAIAVLGRRSAVAKGRVVVD